MSTKVKSKRRRQDRELATVNIRIYPSTRDAMSAAAQESGKTIARIADERFNPHKYVPKP